jgi:rhomboid protease GluP
MNSNQPDPSGEPYPKPPAQAPQTIHIELPHGRPVVTYTLLGITVAVFLLQSLSQLILGNDYVAALGANYAPAIRAGEYWRLITPVFLHGNIIHIAMNMYALVAIGSDLEREYGRGRYLALYLISGFAGNVFSFITHANLPTGQAIYSLGSSTAIFGLLAAEGVFVYHNRRFFGERTRPALINIIGIAILNLVIGQTVPNIDNMGHVGGLLGGVLFAWFAGPLWEIEGLPPILRVVDRRDSVQIQLAAIGVTVLFIAAAFYFIFFH